MNFMDTIEVIDLRIALLKSRTGANNANVIRKLERHKRNLLRVTE